MRADGLHGADAGRGAAIEPRSGVGEAGFGAVEVGNWTVSGVGVWAVGVMGMPSDGSSERVVAISSAGMEIFAPQATSAAEGTRAAGSSELGWWVDTHEDGAAGSGGMLVSCTSGCASIAVTELSVEGGGLICVSDAGAGCDGAVAGGLVGSGDCTEKWLASFVDGGISSEGVSSAGPTLIRAAEQAVQCRQRRQLQSPGKQR